jgi:hypothetical protein
MENIIKLKDILATSNVKKATHDLICKHSVGCKRTEIYTMPCILIGNHKDNIVKIVVFGDRNWANKDHLKRIRYVEKSKLIKR